MRTINKIKAKNINVKNNGFTLIEIVVVVAILGILMAIAVPRFVGVINNAEKQVCFSNCLQLERMYNADLILKDKEHSEIIFSTFLNEYVGDVCPDGGEIVYIDGKVILIRF
ncbi:MAG: type II secretion system protein [Sedimentibacter sp.]